VDTVASVRAAAVNLLVGAGIAAATLAVDSRVA